MQVLAFFDGGQAYVHSPTAEEGNTNLGGAGLGARYSLGENIQARFDYGWQITDHQIGVTTFPSRAHVALLLAR